MPCSESCVESRMRENRTYGSERGDSELSIHTAKPPCVWRLTPYLYHLRCAKLSLSHSPA